jgi:hypothetical protein
MMLAVGFDHFQKPGFFSMDTLKSFLLSDFYGTDIEIDIVLHAKT